MISIDGYLLQGKLEAALKEMVGAINWKGRELKVPNSRRRWDMAYQLNGVTTVVEFDGDQHYCNSLKVKIDNEKDAVALAMGYKVVRFPYWVQLTSETAMHYFNIKADIQQDFPHGFITTEIFPASFCELGIERFHLELEALPTDTKCAVIASLRKKSSIYGAEYVVPKFLMHLINER